jgi:hypothetical protein
MSEEAALDARRPHRARAGVAFEGFSGREQHGDVLVYPKGLLLRTRYLKPVGTNVEFDVEVDVHGGATEHLRGRGLVVFSRWQDQGQRRPAGLGIRVESLDEASRSVMARLFPPVPQRELSDDSPADLPLRAAIDEPEPPEPAPAAAAEPASPTPGEAMRWSAEDELPMSAAQRSASAAGGWHRDPSADADEPVADAPYTAASRRWLEASAPAAGGGLETEAQPAPDDWPAAAAPAAPRIDFAVHAQARGEGRHSLLWVLVGVLIVAVAGGGYWVYARYFDPAARQATGTAPQRPAPSAPAPTLLDEVRAAAGDVPTTAPSTPPAGAEGMEAPAAAAAAPAAPPPAPPLDAAFTAVSDIRWEPVGPGGLRVIIEGNGPFPEDRVGRSRLSAPPRHVLRLRGPVRPFGRSQLAVSSPLLERIRLGAQADGSLQIVLDLGSDTVRVAEPRFEGNRLIVLLSQ